VLLRHAAFAVLLALLAPDASAQTTRTEEIEQARRDKQANLWPERESPLVARANELAERGFREGIADGRGASGFQFVLGEMRSGQGTSVGIGWRQTDLWQERLGLRTTARGTVHGAYMVDARLDFHPLTTRRSFFNLYAKFEDSPRMDFYGRGADSEEANRSSFLLRDFAVDFQAGVALSRRVRVGATGGGVHVTTGPGRRSGVPSTGDIFSPAEAPGIAEDPVEYGRWGAFAAFDYRDSRTGPRAGGLYAARVRQFFDRTLDRFSFPQGEFEAQQYLPYFNGTRVVAFRAAAVLSWNAADQDVPVYFMPTVGGNASLRGFARQRFRDNHSLVLSAEHRWYVFRGLDMSIFADAGKVVARKAEVDLRNLEFAWGIGLRTRIRSSVIMRTDLGFSREGFQLIWTFSDVFGLAY
jgi:hypothetical protein